MKKMFFTALALVAFSFTSMANTIEVKEVVIPVEEKKEVVDLRTKECSLMATYVYEYYIDFWFDGVDDIHFLNELTSALCD